MSDDEVKSWINSFDTVMTDCDGVLWVGSEPIQGSPQMINRSYILWIFLLTIYFYPHVCDRFRELGKRVFYVTNNSTKHRKEYKTKLDKLGFGGDMVMRLNFLTILSKSIIFWNCSQEEIIGTAYLAAAYLEQINFDKTKLVYVVGSTGG